MPNDTVTTVFGGDDSNFQAAARKVKSSVEQLAQFASPMHFFAKAKEGAEQMHEATEHAKEGVESLKKALEPLIAMGAALLGVESIFEGIKHAIEQASERESAQFHFEAISGGADKAASAIERLEKISAETATDFPQLEKGAERFLEAGQSADQAADSMGRLQKIALNSGSDVNELGEIYARVLTKSDVSSKDLVKLAMTGVPGIGAIAQKLKAAETNTAAWNLEIDKTIQGLNRTYEANEKGAASINSFGEKIGLMQQSFTAWAKRGGSAMGDLVKSIGGVGEAGIGQLSGTFGAEFTQGLQQIETETGLSGAALKKFMQEGKFGYDELIAAAGRYREELHKQQSADLEAQKLTNQNDLLEKQKGLLGEVRKAIEKATNKGGIFATVEEFMQTFAGKWQQVKHSIDEAFEAFGKPLIDALKPVLDEVTSYFSGPGHEAVAAWGADLGTGIRDAMHGLQTGDWKPFQKDGETAFAAVVKAAAAGIDSLGIILTAVLSGAGTAKAIVGITKMLIAAATAFGEALMQSTSGPMRKLQAFDIAVMPGVRNVVAARNAAEFAKFTPEQKQAFGDQGGGAKPNALEEVTAGNIAHDSDVIENIKGFSGVLAHVKDASAGAAEAFSGISDVIKDATAKIVAAGQEGSGTDTGSDEWAKRNKVGAYKVEPEKEPAAATSDATAAAGDAQSGGAAPVLARTQAAQRAQAGGGGSFSGFTAPTAQEHEKEAGRGAGERSGSGAPDLKPSVFSGKTSKERWADYDKQWDTYNIKNPLGDAASAITPVSEGNTGNFAAHGTGQSYMGGPLVSKGATGSAAAGSATVAPNVSHAGSAPPANAAAAGLASVLAKIDAIVSAIKTESGFLEKVLG